MFDGCAGIAATTIGSFGDHSADSSTSAATASGVETGAEGTSTEPALAASAAIVRPVLGTVVGRGCVVRLRLGVRDEEDVRSHLGVLGVGRDDL
jgi:hypothetical protein